MASWGNKTAFRTREFVRNYEGGERQQHSISSSHASSVLSAVLVTVSRRIQQNWKRLKKGDKDKHSLLPRDYQTG